jgi:hypothetical protein
LGGVRIHKGSSLAMHGNWFMAPGYLVGLGGVAIRACVAHHFLRRFLACFKLHTLLKQ